MSKIEIIEAVSEGDIETVRNLFTEYQRFLGFDLCFQNFEEELASLPGKYAPPGGNLYLARVGSEAAGCIAFYKMEEGIAELKRLYVRDAFQGLGLGRKLLETAIREIEKIGCRTIRLDSVARLKRARELYDKLGFVECAPYNFNPEEDVYYMELCLAS